MRTSPRISSPPTVAWLTVGSGVAFGLNFVLIAQAPVEANLWPLVFARLSASVLVLIIAAVSANLHAPTGTPLRLAVLAALLDTGANVAMLLALHASLLSLAGVLMSLYPAATVLLAIVVLRERVTTIADRRHGAGAGGRRDDRRRLTRRPFPASVRVCPPTRRQVRTFRARSRAASVTFAP